MSYLLGKQVARLGMTYDMLISPGLHFGSRLTGFVILGHPWTSGTPGMYFTLENIHERQELQKDGIRESVLHILGILEGDARPLDGRFSPHLSWRHTPGDGNCFVDILGCNRDGPDPSPTRWSTRLLWLVAIRAAARAVTIRSIPYSWQRSVTESNIRVLL